MRIIKYPDKSQLPALLARPSMDNEKLKESVADILNEVRNKGDEALKKFTLRFDGIEIDNLVVSKDEIADSEKYISDELKQSINLAIQTITTFHKAQDIKLPVIETVAGVKCWQKSIPIEKIGLYIPGGSAPLFSTVLMLAIPASIAGCKEIILCTPCGKDGKVHPAVLYAARKSGVSKIYKVGGAQAIAAMAYGTESVPKTYKIFGPGNQYVTAAKQLVSLKDVAIDMPAGPSEVLVLADETANPVFVASDLLSQAEHGADSQVILITTCIELSENVIKEIEKQKELLSRREIVDKSLVNSHIILVKTIDEAIRMANEYAPEHLIISVKNYLDIVEKIVNAGSVFLGNYSPESAGDYASGTNHTLPTNGYAKAYSGVNLDSFKKRITFQEISPEGIKRIGPAIETMAEAEALTAHKNAVSFRLKTLK